MEGRKYLNLKDKLLELLIENLENIYEVFTKNVKVVNTVSLEESKFGGVDKIVFKYDTPNRDIILEIYGNSIKYWDFENDINCLEINFVDEKTINKIKELCRRIYKHYTDNKNVFFYNKLKVIEELARKIQC